MAKRPKTAIVQLKVRLDEPLRAKLDKSAKQRGPRGISLNAEIVNRLEQSFAWDEEFGDVKKMIAAHEELLAKERQAAMRAWGFQQVAGRPGLWVETDKIKPEEMLALTPQLKSVIEEAVMSAMDKARQQS